MSWAIGYDKNWGRDIGYGVPAYCDHPGCMEKIDRGLAYVCGNSPYGGDFGCGLYFCENHHFNGKHSLCERCKIGQLPFDPKPECAEWIHFKATDESWSKWRRANPGAVELMKLKADTFVD